MFVFEENTKISNHIVTSTCRDYWQLKGLGRGRLVELVQLYYGRIFIFDVFIIRIGISISISSQSSSKQRVLDSLLSTSIDVILLLSDGHQSARESKLDPSLMSSQIFSSFGLDFIDGALEDASFSFQKASKCHLLIYSVFARLL